MDKQHQEMMQWIYVELGEVCAHIQKRYGVELNAEERSAIGDEMVAQINRAIRRKSRGG